MAANAVDNLDIDDDLCQQIWTDNIEIRIWDAYFSARQGAYEHAPLIPPAKLRPRTDLDTISCSCYKSGRGYYSTPANFVLQLHCHKLVRITVVADDDSGHHPVNQMRGIPAASGALHLPRGAAAAQDSSYGCIVHCCC